MLTMTFKTTLLILALTHCVWTLDWWQKTVIYQIYPRSFKDSDGDGIGDIQGIIQGLDHLKSLGVGAVWISPLYKSPMEDFGYDISNFLEIDPVFGTMEDFDALLARAKELGIKLLMDFVPNDSSVEHEWFQQSLQRIDPYTDYYVWHDGRKLDNGTVIPPNNWQSVFSGSAWEWREERQQYYLHQFAVRQPDLNHNSPALVEEMKNVLRFWLDKGADGYRMDAIAWLFEGPIDNRPDDETVPPQNRPETYEAVVAWRKILDEEYTAKDNVTRFMMTEVTTNNTVLEGYYGTPEAPGAHFPFNFWFIFGVNNESTAHDFADTINNYMDIMNENRWPDWVLGNHDQHRVGTRFGPELIDAMNMLSLLLPGTAVTYQGEEIGMTNTYITWDQCLDPQGLYAGKEHYLEMTRDVERTPMQWDGTPNAGFSTNASTWLPVNPNYNIVNVEHDKQARRSHYWIYRNLVVFRELEIFQLGDLTVVAASDQVLVVRRSYADENVVILVNLDAEPATVDITTALNFVPKESIVLIASLGSNKEGRILDASNIVLDPKESLVVVCT